MVVSGFAERLEHLVFHDFVRNVKTISVLDERPARLAARSVPSESYVGLEIGDNACCTVLRLLSDRDEKEVESVDETLLHAFRSGRSETGPIAKRF